VQIGFIGLGAMGARMADNLRRAGHELVVLDSSITRLEQFCKDEGTASASSPAALAETEGADCSCMSPGYALHAESTKRGRAVAGLRVLITMLPSTAHVQEVYSGSEGILSAKGASSAAGRQCCCATCM
jgi:3-hydroxyisobutyrate dehydrogenase-like beta-hydroxyacid dehydrogenase